MAHGILVVYKTAKASRELAAVCTIVIESQNFRGSVAQYSLFVVLHLT